MSLIHRKKYQWLVKLFQPTGCLVILARNKTEIGRKINEQRMGMTKKYVNTNWNVTWASKRKAITNLIDRKKVAKFYSLNRKLTGNKPILQASCQPLPLLVERSPSVKLYLHSVVELRVKALFFKIFIYDTYRMIGCGIVKFNFTAHIIDNTIA